MKSKFWLLLIVFVFNFTAQARIIKNPAKETRVFEGIVKVLIVEHAKDSERYFLDIGGRFLPLNSPVDKSLVNAKVSITGKLDAANTILPENIKVLESAKTVLDIPVSGPQKVLVLLVNFQNDTSQPVPGELIRQKIFSDTRSPKQFFRQVSDGRLNLTGQTQPDGDVVGYLTLPFTNENCFANDVVNTWSPAEDIIARDRGIDVNRYHSVIYLFTGDLGQCNGAYTFISEIGDRTTTNRIWWVNAFSEFSMEHFQYTIAHEIGHNLGLNHVSGFRTCPWTVPIEACTDFEEYADRSDVMGYFGYHLLSNYNRLRLGWLNGKVTTFDRRGIYYANLHSPNHPTKGATAAQIRLKDANGNFTGKSFYLEFRRNLPPFDIFMQGDFPFPPIQSADKGVTIRYGSEDIYNRLERPFLIDTTPETFDFGDAALLPGKFYFNSYYNVSISTVSVNPFFGARIKIEICPFPDQNCAY